MNATWAGAFAVALAGLLLVPGASVGVTPPVVTLHAPYAHTSQSLQFTNFTTGCNRTSVTTPAYDHSATIQGAFSGSGVVQTCPGANQSVSDLYAQIEVFIPIVLNSSPSHFDAHLRFQLSMSWNVSVRNCTPNGLVTYSYCEDSGVFEMMGGAFLVDETTNTTFGGHRVNDAFGFSWIKNCAKSNCTTVHAVGTNASGTLPPTNYTEDLGITVATNASHAYELEIEFAAQAYASAGGYGVLFSPGSRGAVTFSTHWSVPSVTAP